MDVTHHSPKFEPSGLAINHQHRTFSMDLSSTRIRKYRAPRTVSLRRGTRCVSVPHILGSYYESQTQPTACQTSQPGVTSRTPIETSVPASRTQFEEYTCPSQSHNDQTRKRRSDESIETSPERPQKRARLTKENLKAFEKMGGQRKSATTSDKDSGPRSAQSKHTISTTDSGFQDISFRNGVLDPNYSKPPANLDDRQKRLDRTRDTASPSESDYRYFVSAIRSAPNEASVLYETSTLLKRYDQPGYHKRYNQSFSNFPKNVGFNDNLSAAQPDMVEGLNMPEYEPFPVRDQLGGAATVYSGLAATTLPHLAGEWKGPGKDMILAQTQAAYDGACMVYGRNEARSFLENPDPPSHAFVSTFTTDGTTLNTFTHYSSKTQGKVKYHQYPTSSSFLISNFEDFKKSRRRLRNLQDDAKETSEKLRDELVEGWAGKGDDSEEGHDNEEGPTSQLLTEYWTSFSANNEEESFVQIPHAYSVYAPSENNLDESSVRIPAADSMHAPPYAIIQDDSFMHISDNGHTSPITPPQSSKDVSLSLESGDHGRTRRTRTRAVDTVEERNTRKKLRV